jgi:hypothetical protein
LPRQLGGRAVPRSGGNRVRPALDSGRIVGYSEKDPSNSSRESQREMR